MFPSGNGVFARFPSSDDQTALAVIYVGREIQQPARAVAPRWPEASPPSTGLTLPAPTHGTGPGQPAQATSTGAPTPAAPADAVSVLNRKTGDGRQVAIRTGEPTLLPPLAESQQTTTTTRTRAGAKGR
jgi:hypothetical protein